MRFRLDIEYDGTNYHGWQFQDGLPTVQGVIEHAIKQFCGIECRLQVAGRTDAGVHATGQVAHADLDISLSAFRVLEALNHYLAEDPVVIRAVTIVDDTFHARFGAVERRYCYTILNRLAPASLDRHRVWHVKKTLNIDAMQAAANDLLGTHDFTSFRASECQSNSPIKTLDEFIFHQVGDYLHAHVRAKSFLHHQVRNMIGTLVLVGKGKLASTAIPGIISAKKRSAAGPTAPAKGLVMTGVGY